MILSDIKTRGDVVSFISCPFDAVSVFDGTDNKSPLIGTYCGQQRNLVLYSTEQFLTVTFTTLERTADSQNRGFIGMFQFSESFVKLGKEKKCPKWGCLNQMDCRGTEPDRRTLLN